jgi:hypothetical protein
VFDWLKRMRSQPKRGSRGSRSGPGRPGGGRDAREPTEYLRSGGQPAPERFPAPAAPEAWRPPPAPAPSPVAPPPTPPVAAPSPRASGSETIISAQSSDTGELVAALVGVSGVLRNKLYPVYANENHLGREGKGGLFGAEDQSISRDHGTLRCDDGKFHIRPLSERYAINLNGERLSDDGEFLHDGDMLQMGQTTFRFKVL